MPAIVHTSRPAAYTIPAPAPEEKVTPYRPSGGEITFGALKGAAIGGFAGLGAVGFGVAAMGVLEHGWLGALDRADSRGVTIALVGAAILGTVTGGIVGGATVGSSHDDAERRRIKKEQGAPIADFAATLMTPFDHNKSGRIELTNPSGLDKDDERTSLTPGPAPSPLVYDWWNGDIDVNHDPGTLIRTSATRLWDAARDGDDVVTANELQHLLVRYSGNDGRVNDAEQAAIMKAFPTTAEEIPAP